MKSLLPSKGMRDFMPKEKELREFVKDVIRNEYKKNGFTEIETPAIENIDRLVDSDGGDNTKLIFKILKRGEKLDLGKDGLKEEELADLGLRFDLTLPLSRFYSKNQNDLPRVFKAIQIGDVYRAERPQKGRYRSFVQCDVDVFGDATSLTEIELINTVSKALRKIGLEGFTVKLNDRRILRDVILKAGFSIDEFPSVCVSLDKLDKIGKEGIVKELDNQGYSKANIESLMGMLDDISEKGIECLESYSVDLDAIENMKTIIGTINGLKDENYNIEFDFTLVRGMGYYTSSIFEVAYGDLGYSVAGGGRYDEMVGKMTGRDVPACGFSIGYERIVDILREKGFEGNKSNKLAILYGEDDDLLDVMKLAEDKREEFDVVSVYARIKKMNKQLNQLKDNDFTGFIVFGRDENAIKSLD